MNPKWISKFSKFLVIVSIMLSWIMPVGIKTASAQAGSLQPTQATPIILADPVANWVQSLGWPADTILTLTINRAGSQVFETTATVGPAPWNPDDMLADFQVSQKFDLQIGDGLTVTDGTVSKIYTVANTQVTNVNAQADTISGMATPGMPVTVCANAPGSCFNRRITANPDGTWLVDFHASNNPQDDPGSFDLQPGSTGWAAEQAPDGNQTWADWRVPNPYIWAHPGEDWVQTRDWPSGAEITLDIDDPTNGVSIDYHDTATVQQAFWNADDLLANFQLSGKFDVKPGDIVTVTGPNASRTYTIANPQVREVNIQSDVVGGKAAPGSSVHVWIYLPSSTISRYVKAGQDGNWSVDFSVPGSPPDDTTVDLQMGSGGQACEQDLNGNETWVDWNGPKPTFDVRTWENVVEGESWPADSQISLYIDGELFNQQPISPTLPPWGDPNFLVVRFGLDGPLQEGQQLTMTDGQITKTYTVSNLSIAGGDAATGTIWGTAKPGAWIETGWMCDAGGCAVRRTRAKEDGTWQVDFSKPGEGSTHEDAYIYHIQANDYIEIHALDEDGDGMNSNWHQPVPGIYIDAHPQLDIVNAYVWNMDLGTELSMTIDDPTTPDQLVDYQSTSLVQSTNDPNFIRGVFQISGFILKPGDVITVSGAGVTIPYTVSDPKITQFDIVNDTVSGEVLPGEDGQVCANLGAPTWGCSLRNFTADQNGKWSAEFSKMGSSDNTAENQIVDIIPGTTFWLLDRGNNGSTFIDSIVTPLPTSGSARGGGWITFPAGSYPAQPNLAGKATLSLAASYLHGKTTPVGETTFSFPGFTFTCTSFDWLAVEGPRLQLEGTGAVKGKGSYGFTITATDGQLSGGGGMDLYRIRIWDKASGSVLFDTMSGQPDFVIPTAVVQGGQIMIMKNRIGALNEQSLLTGSPLYLPIINAQ